MGSGESCTASSDWRPTPLRPCCARRFFLFTHIDFDIKYNEDRVIEINVSTDPQQAVDISEGVQEAKVKFTYSVRWTPTATTFDRRLARYERFPLNPVHLEVRPGLDGMMHASWCLAHAAAVLRADIGAELGWPVVAAAAWRCFA